MITVIARDGAMVAIDPVSLDILRGSKIDFIDDLMGRMFKIDNPGGDGVLWLRIELLPSSSLNQGGASGLSVSRQECAMILAKWRDTLWTGNHDLRSGIMKAWRP